MVPRINVVAARNFANRIFGHVRDEYYNCVIRRAVKRVPYILCSGRLFHFTQSAWKRKISDLKWSENMKSDGLKRMSFDILIFNSVSVNVAVHKNFGIFYLCTRNVILKYLFVVSFVCIVVIIMHEFRRYKIIICDVKYAKRILLFRLLKKKKKLLLYTRREYQFSCV